jgi:3'-phosphoadenosine 5'-phosphosulfate sulfotransferase (PAPS reductase)/FAD synthetase
MQMSNEHNIVSVSGGKDSTALLLLAIERETENLQAVFADTGHEHPQTYEYVKYLNDKVFPIRTIKADFTERIAKKAQFVSEKWKPSLMADIPGVPGRWEYIGPGAPAGTEIVVDEDGEDRLDWERPEQPPDPRDPYAPQSSHVWKWHPAIPPRAGATEAEAEEKIQRALAVLKPTGNPFLDLCIWKGRFPSTKARFCSEELKRNPITDQVHNPLINQGIDVVSWQGVRADESENRRNLPERECKVVDADTGAELWNYRPILTWTAEDAFAMHRKHGIEPNPLYKQGMGRVGCMPCIHCRKDELLEISKRFPEEVARVAEWERIVGEASKRDRSTFFATAQLAGPQQTSDGDEVTLEEHGIWQAVEWAKTSRGGRQYDIFRVEGEQESAPLCTSIYGLCE